MNRRNTIISSIVLSAVIFVLSWLTYETVLDYVISGVEARVVVFNPTKAFGHHLMMSLMMGFLGLMIGFSTLLSGRFSREIEYGKRFALFLGVGFASSSITIVYISYNLGWISRYLSHDQPMLAWSISMIPVHKIGLYSSITVLLIGLISAMFYKK